MSGPPPVDPALRRVFFPHQIAAIAEQMGRLGLVTDVEVRRRTEVTPTTGSDYGDDIISYDTTDDSRHFWVKGWLSHPGGSDRQEVDSGSVTTTGAVILRVPLGTDIDVGDEVIVGDDDYIVDETNSEDTFKVFVRCGLRRRE